MAAASVGAAAAGGAAAALGWRAAAWGAGRADAVAGQLPVWLLVSAMLVAGALWEHPPLALLPIVALTAAAVDVRCGLIPDALTLPACALLLVVRDSALVDALEGAVVCALLLGVPWAVSRGRGFGFGDVKFGLVLGAALGPSMGACAVGAAFVCGGFVGAALLLTRRASRETELPFAPFLAAGAAVIAVTISRA